MLPCAYFYENIYLENLSSKNQDGRQTSKNRPSSQSRIQEKTGRILTAPKSKFSENALNPSSMMLLSEADYCISKIKMQVSGIEHASAVHH